MNPVSEQTKAPAAGTRGSDLLGWFLASALALAWFVSWGLWMGPAEPVSRAAVSGASSVSFLSTSATGNDSHVASSLSFRSPAVFSLPSAAGFSRGALTNGIGARPPLQVPGGAAVFLDRPGGGTPESGYRFAPPLEESVRDVLTNLPGRFPESPVFGAAVTAAPALQVELSPGLDRKRLRAMEVPSDEVLLKEKPWEVTALVEFNDDGRVSGVFLERKSSFEEVDSSLIHALWRWQVEDAKTSMSGRVVFRSPGRPQFVREPQNTVGP